MSPTTPAPPEAHGGGDASSGRPNRRRLLKVLAAQVETALAVRGKAAGGAGPAPLPDNADEEAAAKAASAAAAGDPDFAAAAASKKSLRDATDVPSLIESLGESCASFYFAQDMRRQGRGESQAPAAELKTLSPAEREQLFGTFVADVGSGETVGETSILAQGRRHCTIVAQQPTVLLVVNAAAYARIMNLVLPQEVRASAAAGAGAGVSDCVTRRARQRSDRRRRSGCSACRCSLGCPSM